ncbi:hypothetical protein B0H12DRAFT_1112318 [Mycena haematopus]|nr:hypothetical protein B0H12DRAFT_1112318 [Mycena haematopus]
MASGIEPGSSLQPLSIATGPNFEFGKRKRWADLVVTELVDVLLLVLSPQGKVLYCGNGLKGLLGWTDTDIIDYDFTDLLDAEDRDGFTTAFQESLRTGNAMTSIYVRIRTAPSTLSDPPMSEQLVFEVNGRAQITEAIEDSPEDAVQVFFMVAKPHPNKSVAMLDNFLDLQEEHDRLQHRVSELRARAPRSIPSSPTLSTVSSQTSMYATTSMVTKHLSQSPNTFATPQAGEISPSPASTGQVDDPGATTSAKPDDDDDQLKKKKPQRKVVPTEQYVCITCGRTDSPEWRKGPLGPKTLCNACGLRWAKQAKGQKLTEEAATVPHPS